MKKTILLIEDSKFQQLATEQLLLRAGYLVLLAGDGEEGLRLARESLPDLILLDLRLPGVEGETVLEVLKSDVHTRRIPVIIVSDSANANAVKLKAAGAVDYFKKSRIIRNSEGEASLLYMIDKVIGEAADEAAKASAPLASRQGA